MSDSDNNGLVIGVDNDEFLGDFSNASLYHQYLKFFKVSENDRKTRVIKYLCDNFCIRPYVDKLLMTLSQIKSKYPKKVKIAMITSCKDTQGWVTMLKNCLEEIFQCPGLYDVMIPGEYLPTDFAKGIARKDKFRIMHHPGLRCPKWNFVMLDDKPSVVTADKIISASSFFVMSPAMKYIIEIPGVRKFFQDTDKKARNVYMSTINKGYNAGELIGSQEKAASNEELLGVIEELNGYVSEVFSA